MGYGVIWSKKSGKQGYIRNLKFLNSLVICNFAHIAETGSPSTIQAVRDLWQVGLRPF
jgi:hypothetical protein